MRVDLFDFELPQERIAIVPASPRDSARMLHVKTDGIADQTIRDLTEIIRPDDILVSNDTKVIPAQLFGKRPSRADGEPVSIEATLHRDIGNNCWRAFVRPAKRVKAGDVIEFGGSLSAEVIERNQAEAVLQFDTRGVPFEQAIENVGVMPLPPYIARKRAAGDEDKSSYQTVFASEPGSVAAPTAGLHFTHELLENLKARGATLLSITLHVGAGTFLPVSVDDTDSHKMHSEWGEITPKQAQTINDCKARGGRIIAVGTTSLRLLESAANQDGTVKPFADETDIFITPGYKFRTADILLTNFHLPRSTLFMLVCAFAGIEKMKHAYKHAIENEYRFYSYGDACLLEREQ